MTAPLSSLIIGAFVAVVLVGANAPTWGWLGVGLLTYFTTLHGSNR